MSPNGRRHIPGVSELRVLDRSRRRCALCFHIDGDLAEKHGQLAHLDQNPANCAEDNLAWLCLPHHSVYDSKTSQHKNYTVPEAKKARDDLYRAIANGMHLSASASPARGREADRKILVEILRIFDPDTMVFFRTYDFGGSFAWQRVHSLTEIASHADGAEYEFIDPDLEALRKAFLETAAELRLMLVRDTFPVRGRSGINAVADEMELEASDRLYKIVRAINDGAYKFCDAYDGLVRAARQKLEP